MPRIWKCFGHVTTRLTQQQNRIYIETRGLVTTFGHDHQHYTNSSSNMHKTGLYFVIVAQSVPEWSDIRLRENEFDRNTSPCGKAAAMKLGNRKALHHVAL